MSQLISFSFPSSCDLISGVSSSSLMRVDYHMFITLNWLSACVPSYLEFFPTVDISSCAERKSYLTEQFFFASSPVRSAMLGYTAAASASDNK